MVPPIVPGDVSAVSNISKLIETFRAGLNLAADVDVRTLHYREIKEWDSVGHMVLVGALEETFDVMLDTDDVLDMSSFDKAIEILGRYDVDFAT
jgi:acyl carrier protein